VFRKPLRVSIGSCADAGAASVGSVLRPRPWATAGEIDSFGAVADGNEFAARVYAAINARDREAIKALSAPDIVVATTVETHRGPEALLEWMAEGDDAFDDFVVELIDVEQLGANVVVSMRRRGRGKASGAEVELPFTHVWTIRDDRAVRVQSFRDRYGAVRYAHQRERA
jgi:ketosteroid isomerase-like protein